MPTALVDSDMIVFKSGMANESRSYYITDAETGAMVKEEKYKKDAALLVNQMEKDTASTFHIELHREVGPLSHSLANAKTLLETATKWADSNDYEVFIDGPGNYRYDLYPAYKGHRRDGLRPIHEEEIREYIKKYWGGVEVRGEEADDAVSYMQCLSETGSTYIASCDKDLQNTPGWLWNWDKQEELRWITPEEADLNFAKQLLIGDTADNICGIRGIGPKKADKLLHTPGMDWKSVVRQEYERVHGDGWLDAININGALLWMRRAPNEIWDWDYAY